MASTAALAAGGPAKAPGKRRISVGEDEDALAWFPFARVLTKEPAARDEASVRDALDDWLETLLVNGVELAQDLRAPREVLLEVFRRGRLGSYQKGQKVMEEAEDVKHFMIVLQGRVQFRCKPPKEYDGSASVPASFLDKDGYAVCDNFGRGEALGVTPGDSQRSSYEASATERSLLLLLSASDYAASLGPFHQGLLAETADFLQRHRLCPNAGATQLLRLAAMCRLRTARRGAVLEQAGTSQRYVRFLKSGVVSLLLPKDDAAALGSEAQQEDAAGESSQSEDERLRLDRLRNVAGGGREGQQAAAAEEKHSAAVLKYSRGKQIKRSLQKRPRSPPKPDSVVAQLRDPGAIVGEETLVFDSLKEAIMAKSCYTSKAETDCVFYTCDLTTWRSLTVYMGQENIAECVDDRMQRRTTTLGRSASVERRVNQQVRRTQRREAARENRQRIRLPGTCNSGVVEVENLNDWLGVTYTHRKAPINEKNPGSLVCLEALNIDSLTMDRGPGVDAMLKVFASDGTANRIRLADVQGHRSRWSRHRADSNPMGDVLPAKANYADAVVPGALALEPPASEPASMILPDDSQADPGGGIFFQTELDFDDTDRTKAQPQPPGQRTLVQSSSVPTLPSLSPSRSLVTAAGEDLGSGYDDMQRSMSQMALGAGTGTEFRRTSALGGGQPTMRPPKDRRDLKVAKAFSRAAAGKNVLVLTDAPDVMKTLNNVMLNANLGLFFARSTNELLKRFGDPKEQWHALFVDLNKREMQVETLLKTIRGHSKYGKLPVVVISGERELSDLVRQECSFVVFKPIAQPTLREALLWCFDRRTLEGYYREKGVVDESTISLGATRFASDAVKPVFGKQAHFEENRPVRTPVTVSAPTEAEQRLVRKIIAKQNASAMSW